MPDTPNGLLGLIQSGWTQIMAIVGIIWWSRKIDLRTKDHADRLDRHEARLRVYRAAGTAPFAANAELANARISLFGTWY